MDQLLRVAGQLYLEWQELGLVARVAVASFLLGFPLAWVWEMLRFATLLGRTDRVHLAPVHVHGAPLTAMGSQGVALALRGELEAIRRSQRMLTDQPAPYVAPSMGRDQGYYLVGLRRDIPLPSRVAEAPELPRIEQEITIQVGQARIPVSAIINLLSALLGAVTVPFRGTYRSSLIRVAMVAHENMTRLTVHLTGDRYAADHPRWWQFPTVAAITRAIAGGWSGRPAGQPAARARDRAVFTVTRTTENLTQVADLLRDAAFMVLTLHRGDSLSWWSNRRLIDGLDALADYRRLADTGSRDRARAAFKDAALADPEHNHHALYFHGVMTMVDRKVESIDEALVHFQTALEQTAFRPLQALIHTGIAYCQAQRVHRLGYDARSTLDKAYEHARAAERLWRQAFDQSDLGGTRFPHPLIPYTYGLVIGVDETPAPDPQGRRPRDRHLKAALHFHRAAQLERDNGMFYNNVGWTLLKLLERGVEDVTASLALGTLTGATDDLPDWAGQDNWERLEEDREDPTRISVADTAEAYLRFALQLQPGNKLTHANLCLLYSMPAFRDRRDEDRFTRCRYHGLKAVTLDPEYINGHRDLAIGLVRYGHREEAKEHYYRALELAEDPDKDRELVRDVVGELKRAFPKMTERGLRSWTHPERSFFEPHGVERERT